MEKKKVVVLSGAGVSAESGVKTFRDANGLWENHRIEDVATPEAWNRDMELVLRFYNQRRKQALEVEPNAAHYAIAALEQFFDVHVVTQNVDNLHERAGSTQVLHLHGELFKARSTKNPSLVYDIAGWELKAGDLCEEGSQLRPGIVWFGEEVPNMSPAIEIAEQADIFIVIGTSLVVYPAAGLFRYTRPQTPIYVIDVHRPEITFKDNMSFIQEKATVGMQQLKDMLIEGLSA
ncbi:NAD-dependent deacylase [Ravibacter arvi]|uniref:NAD-dependent protein deacylase n=1 Tax=Ravibacter arvi TaxID=2051041 RepID=A0ABP8LWS0_9BACT